MKRLLNEPAFIFYTLAITAIFITPLVAWLFFWLVSLMSPILKWIALYILAMAILAYEFTHTFNIE